jgi:hypothetical protein
VKSYAIMVPVRTSATWIVRAHSERGAKTILGRVFRGQRQEGESCYQLDDLGQAADRNLDPRSWLVDEEP